MLNKSPRDHFSKDDTAVPPEERKFKKKNSMKNTLDDSKIIIEK